MTLITTAGVIQGIKGAGELAKAIKSALSRDTDTVGEFKNPCLGDR